MIMHESEGAERRGGRGVNAQRRRRRNEEE